MRTAAQFHIVLASALTSLPLTAAEPDDHDHADDHEHPHPSPTIDLLTGEGLPFDDIITPVLYLSASFGGTTADSPATLATGHHDPQDQATLQTLEPGLTLHLGQHLEAFAIGSATTDPAGDLDATLEEAFLHLHHLPAGLSLRAGRFLNGIGFHNTAHNHAWQFVNNHLLNGRLLQEGELTTEGAELTWNLPSQLPFNPAIALSHGRAPSHDDAAHAHGHGSESDSPFDIEGALFESDFTTASLTLASDDHHQRIRLSTAWGENAFQRHTQIISLAHQITWTRNQTQTLTWHNEIAHRRFGATPLPHEDEDEDHHDDEHHDEPAPETLDEFAALTALTWHHNDHLSTGLRLGYTSRIAAADRDQRFRTSPNLTFHFGPAKNAHLRLQLDLDHSTTHGTNTSAWLQFGYAWGGTHQGHHH